MCVIIEEIERLLGCGGWVEIGLRPSRPKKKKRSLIHLRRMKNQHTYPPNNKKTSIFIMLPV
jgi:hypothetical protein